MDEMQLTDGDVFITFNTESENYRLVMTTAESAKGFRKAIEGIVSSSCTTAKPLVGRPPQFSGCPETGLSQVSYVLTIGNIFIVLMFIVAGTYKGQRHLYAPSALISS